MFQKSLTETGLSGGSLRVTIPVGLAIQGTTTETPIKRCWIMANQANSRVRIGSACTLITGMALPNGTPVCLEGIGDLSLLYFYSAVNADTLDINYLT
jgi:hypothetical protein